MRAQPEAEVLAAPLVVHYRGSFRQRHHPALEAQAFVPGLASAAEHLQVSQALSVEADSVKTVAGPVRNFVQLRKTACRP